MKKNPIFVSIILAIAAAVPLQSCIGSFALTNKVIHWNNQVGSKFINELVFFAFWVLPVYEVTAVADLIVLNSIEFWSGNNPVQAYEKSVQTDHGTYHIACGDTGYEILTPNGETLRLTFEKDSSTWSVIISENETYPFMTMIDADHVKLITPEGDFRMFEVSESGLQAYSSVAQASLVATR